MIGCAFILCVGCQTAYVKPGNNVAGIFNTRVQIREKAKDKRYVVDAVIAAEKFGRLRLDLTSFEGLPLGRVAMVKDRVYFRDTDNRVSDLGSSSNLHPSPLKKILPAEYDLKWFHNLLFEAAFENADWNCEMNAQQELKSCESVNGIKVKWEWLDKQKRLISVDTQRTALVIEVSSFRPKSELADEVFSMPDNKAQSSK